MPDSNLSAMRACETATVSILFYLTILSQVVIEDSLFDMMGSIVAPGAIYSRDSDTRIKRVM